MNYRKTQVLISLTIIIGFSSSAFGQSSEDKLGSWYIYNGFLNITPKFELFVESQLRNWETFSNPETFLLRPYFNYNLTKNIQAGLGFEFHTNWTFDEVPDNRIKSAEFRTTMQMMLFHKIDRFSFQHRYRYEFRWVDSNHLQRARYRFQVTVPLTAKTMQKGVVFFNTNLEFLVDTQPTLALSQMRNYFAAGYQFTDNLNLQVGYLAVSRTGTVHNRLQFFLTHKLYFFDK